MSVTRPVLPPRGQRQQGELVSDLPLLRGWAWPYVVINGAQDGPRATIIGGIHGCEYVSIRAAMRLATELKPEELIGSVLIVPIVNLPAYWDRTAFVSPYDGVNPNRVFPGKATGTFSEAMAHFIFQSCIVGSDAFIDLHGGDIVEELVPFAIFAADVDPDVTERSRTMAGAFGLPYTISQRREAGTLGGMTFAAAADLGIPGLIAEAGGIGQLTEPEVDLLVDGTRRALQVTGNLTGEPASPGTTFLDRFDWLYSREAGFWIADVRAGDAVKTGQRLGTIHSLLGEPIEVIDAPNDGVVVFRTTSAAVKSNGLLLAIGA